MRTNANGRVAPAWIAHAEWMLSGPTTVLRPSNEKRVYQLALEIAMQTPDAVFRNPEKLALACEHQRADRERFTQFFGTDLVVVPGDEDAFSDPDLVRRRRWCSSDS